VGADSVADAALPLLQALSAKNVLSRKAKTKALSANNLSREAKDKTPLSDNSEAISTSLKEKALHSSPSTVELEQ